MSMFWNLLVGAAAIVILSVQPAAAKGKGPGGESTQEECEDSFSVCSIIGCYHMGALTNQCLIDCNTEYNACVKAVSRSSLPPKKKDVLDTTKKPQDKQPVPQQDNQLVPQ